ANVRTSTAMSNNACCRQYHLSMLLVDKHISISSLAGFHIHYNLVCLIHRPLLDPGLDLSISGEFEHFLNLAWRSDATAANLDSVHQEGESVNVGQAASIGCTLSLAKRSANQNSPNLDVCSSGLEQTEVVHERHLLRADRADNEIEASAVLGSPVLVLASCDVFVGSKGKGILSLIALSGDSDDTITAEGFCKENTKVAETSNANDTDSLARACTIHLEW
ncbi:hypothetical protein HII31_01154, partial [Pseudocercospora fuligena]